MNDKTNYLTPEGHTRLKSELTQLIEHERPKVVEQVSVAAAMGDRSENAEYIYGKRRLREIDRRIRFLQGRLKKVEIIDPSTVALDRVAFGTWVQVDSDEGEAWYQIVGPDEIDPARQRITYSSPIGRALLGKKEGDLVTVQRPKGALELEIIAIRRKAE